MTTNGWWNRLTADEAEKAIDEYRRFHADGPPYPNTRNKHVLQDRDHKMVQRLRDRIARG